MVMNTNLLANFGSAGGIVNPLDVTRHLMTPDTEFKVLLRRPVEVVCFESSIWQGHSPNDIRKWKIETYTRCSSSDRACLKYRIWLLVFVNGNL